LRSPLASAGVEGRQSLRPGVLRNHASTEFE
jgi:hypothetical protein